MQIRQFSLLVVGIAVPLALATLPAQAETVGTFTDALTAIGSGSPVSLHVFAYPNPPYETTGSTPVGNFFVGLTEGVLTVGGQYGGAGVTSSDPFYMYCVDFGGTISVPTDYDVSIVHINGTDPNSTPDGPPGLNLPLSTLQLQAILGAGFGTPPLGSAGDVDLQEEIWNLSTSLLTGPALNPFPTTAGMTADYNAALATYNSMSVDFTNEYLLNVTNAVGQQAFMPVDSAIPVPGTTDSSPTPEPATFGLMIMAVAGLGFAARKRLSGRI